MREVNFLKVFFKNEKEFLDFIDKYPGAINRASDKSLQDVALHIKKDTKKLIESGELGARSKFADMYSSLEGKRIPKFRKKVSLRSLRSKESDEGLLFLMRYYQWQIDNLEQKNLKIYFRESSKEHLNHLIKNVQTGAEINVTKKMRGAFGATDFPLKKGTTSINIPERDIDKKVYTRNKEDIFDVFRTSFHKRHKGIILRVNRI